MSERESEDDWETTALRQVASRVESLTTKPTAQDGARALDSAGVDDGFGWEESVLRRLRARLFSDDLSD